MKRRFISVAIILFLIAVCAGQNRAAAFQVGKGFNVKWVDDGDTIVLSNGQRVRYLGINTPEIAHENRPAEPFGATARVYNQKMVLGKQVRLETDQQRFDHYGRVLAYVFLNDGTFVNAKLVAEGYAYCLFKRPNTKYQSRLLEIQRHAMEARKGMWRNWHEEHSRYLGNKKSRRFHRPNCSFGKRSRQSNQQFFKTQWDAFWAGYAPCKKCLPTIKSVQKP